VPIEFAARLDGSLFAPAGKSFIEPVTKLLSDGILAYFIANLFLRNSCNEKVF
jgi:hypothetical protein